MEEKIMSWEQKREQSYQILEKYKHSISQVQYEHIMQNIGTHAIEDMFLDEDDIVRLVKISRGEITAEETISQLKKDWGVSSNKRKTIWQRMNLPWRR